jgi:NADP-dependent 3-hydroxy acid dehydrogenase YdfG
MVLFSPCTIATILTTFVCTIMKAIITGASKGIGRAIAEKFVKEGASIAICSRNERELWDTAIALKHINDVTIYHEVADLSNKQDCIRFAQNALQALKGIDILVNNAGAYIPGSIVSEPDGNLELLMSTNLYSAYHITRAVVPTMVAQKNGHVFNVSSIAALQAYTNGGSYSISKFALQGFSKNLREELKAHNVKVTTVNPGATMSNSWSGSGVAEERIMKASDIADTIWSVYNLAPQTVVEDIVLRPMLGDL